MIGKFFLVTRINEDTAAMVIVNEGRIKQKITPERYLCQFTMGRVFSRVVALDDMLEWTLFSNVKELEQFMQSFVKPNPPPGDVKGDSDKGPAPEGGQTNVGPIPDAVKEAIKTPGKIVVVPDEDISDLLEGDIDEPLDDENMLDESELFPELEGHSVLKDLDLPDDEGN